MSVKGYFGNFLNWTLQIFRVLEFGLIPGLLTVTSDFLCLFDKLSVQV
jgi:hypothetical protein